MKLDKAIELLNQALDEPGSVPPIDLTPAMKLGIEALKRISLWRAFLKKYDLTVLPGETEETTPAHSLATGD